MRSLTYRTHQQTKLRLLKHLHSLCSYSRLRFCPSLSIIQAHISPFWHKQTPITRHIRIQVSSIWPVCQERKGREGKHSEKKMARKVFAWGEERINGWMARLWRERWRGKDSEERKVRKARLGKEGCWGKEGNDSERGEWRGKDSEEKMARKRRTSL